MRELVDLYLLGVGDRPGLAHPTEPGSSNYGQHRISVPAASWSVGIFIWRQTLDDSLGQEPDIRLPTERS